MGQFTGIRVASNIQQVIPAMKGSMFSKKWAYLVKERSTNPLRVQLVEEVDERVSKTLI